MGAAVVVGGLALSLVCQAAPSAAGEPRAGSVGPATRPNILFVLTDDLDLAELSSVPNVAELIGAEGVTFDDAFVNVSWCCPSRVTMLTGQYAHNTGVYTNGPVNGGFEVARALGVEQRTIATTLHAAGYRTGLFGKYLNGYPGSAGDTYVPPGWSSWASPVAGDPYTQYNYVLNEDGVLRSHGHAPSDYLDGVSVSHTRQFIEDSARSGVPFFAYLSLYAPHDPAPPAPGDEALFAGTLAPRSPAFDQADVSGMPSYIRSLPRLRAGDTAEIDALYQRRLASLAGVGREVASLLDTLRSTGQLDNTYVVFTSDNGYHLGQHRLPAGKETPYDTDSRVPLLVRGPGIRAGVHMTGLVGNVDVAPTFASMAGLRPAAFVDGRSWLDFVRGADATLRSPRRAFLLQHWRESDTPALLSAGTRRGTLEPPDLDQQPRAPSPTGAASATTVLFDDVERVPQFAAVRTLQYLYVEYATGERELYDVLADPEQVTNLAGPGAVASAVEQRLSGRLAALQSCRRGGCRAADRSD